MTDLTWNRLGPREKQILAILRRAGESQTSRDVLDALREQDVEVAYTTVSTTLDRLAGKDLVHRTSEGHGGATRFRYTFDATPHRRRLVDGVVADIASVLGPPGLELLADRATTATTDTQHRTRPANDTTHDSP